MPEEPQEQSQKNYLLWAALLVIFSGLSALPLLVFSGGWDTLGAVFGFPPGPGTGAYAVPPEVTNLLPGEGPELELRPEYLSFALDLATLTQGEWWDKVHPSLDLEDPRLKAAAKALSPAFLRTGGTEADRLFYALEDGTEGLVAPLPAGYKNRLSRGQWLQILSFTRETGLQLVFTLNAGPGPRNGDGKWDPGQAQKLMEAAAEAGYSVPVWELGNEVGAHWLFHGLAAQMNPGSYIRDLQALKILRDQRSPDSLILFQGSAFWPVEGETLGPLTGFWPRHMAQAGLWADILNWHYYPFQSGRSPVRTSPALQESFLDPGKLAETTRQALQVAQWAHTAAPGKELWLGETGSAQAGGEPGLSDSFSSALWWADHLGRLARTGQKVVIRQTLAGGDYGLLDPETYAPRPDFWVSLLWKKLMGSRSLGVLDSPSPWIRIYRHSAGTPGEGPVWLVVNLSDRYPTTLHWDSEETRDIWILSGEPSNRRGIFINKEPPPSLGESHIPMPKPAKQKSVFLPPRSLAFVAEPGP